VPKVELIITALHQVGESYYLPMTSYLDTKTTVKEGKLDLPGPLSFSERIASNALSDRYGRVYMYYSFKR
jgi:hypothetical protein